ncbi:MAG: hypothetical protein COV48_07970 [Elusimicrobia bacterium CG11_big_fil_rev_8_21_14_0_20_64_6]|nr:MAG: hypothetical protein COV48_07970 [Elusimicrobia bacterium CG11_big_fil_rev_8_21_14_0_20_64_6]
MKLKTKIASKSSKSKPAKKSPLPSAVCVLSDSEASITLDVKVEGIESIFGAAYLMMDKAFVFLSGDRAKKIVVVLRPKDEALPLRALADEFLSDLESQKVRWAVAKNNLPVREFIAEQAVLIANGTIPPPSASEAAPEPAAEELTADQRSEIERLIAEVESEIKTMNDRKVALDPKGIKASWEETQEKKA